jgi:CRP-like cAMP-binding protein
VHLASRGPGEAFGELAIIDGKPRMADAVTAVPTELLMLDRDAFVQCIQTSPKIAFAVMSYLADRIREAGVQMESRQVLDVRGRLAERLLELAAASGREGADGEVRITARITQQDLADQIGTTRETINRELARMKAVQAIRMEGRRIVLTNRKKLAQYSRK